MPYLLNIAYLLLLFFISPWILAEAIRKGKYRQGLAAKLLGQVPLRSSSGRCVWLHAVSVGEVNTLAPLLERIATEHPDWHCVLSTTTKTGYELARRRFSENIVFYCPLDFSWAVRRAMRRVRPDMLVLTELELWPNLIWAARRSGAKIAVVNGRLSEHSHRGYRRIRPLVRRLLQQIDLIATQTDEFADRFRDLGAPPSSLQVTGSIKFDGAETNRENPTTQKLRRLAGIGPSDVVFLAGSTQHPEESLALASFCELKDQYPALRLILVPRHPERFDEVADMLSRSGVDWRRRSELSADTTGRNTKNQTGVLLVDTVGELDAWWGTAQIALVGGSLSSRGGQNMIEPAAYGAAVAFGPNTWNFRDVVELLLRHDAARVVRNGQEIERFAQECLANPAWADSLGRRAQEAVLAQKGATARTVELLDSAMGQRSNSHVLNRAA